MPAIANPWIDESSPTEGGQEAPAAADPNTAAAGLVAEIELALAESEGRFVLDVPAFMEAIDPMFLQGERA